MPDPNDRKAGPVSDERPRRRSLSARLSLWILLSTTLTLLTFASAVYLLVRLEQGEAAPSVDGKREPAEDASEQVLVAMAIVGPLCILVSVGAARLLSRSALAPIAVVTRAAQAITPSELHTRLSIPKHDDELRDLAVSLNALLVRLDEGFDALSSYASSASHELRTPLAVITSELEIALRRPRTPEQWEGVARTSLDELRELSRLVESLLELSRASAGANTPGVRFELRAGLDQALAALDASVRQAGITLVPPPDGDAVWLHGDEELLTNAVRELVRNAARYTPSGSTVKVTVEKAASHASIHVDDSGPGVEIAERKSIFEPFQRGRHGKAGQEVLRGFGLGLSIAKRSVERWGGTIAVSDSPLGGARFSIVVPTSAAPEA